MGEDTKMYGSVAPGEADAMLSESSTPVPAASASSNPARKVVGLLCVAAAVVGALSFATPSSAAADVSDAVASAAKASAHADSAGAKAAMPEPAELMIDPTEVDMSLEKDSYETVIEQSDFMGFPRVKEWLKDVYGLDSDSDPAILSNYVPEKMVIRGRPQLIMGGGKEGTLGEDVMEGHTLFAISYWNQTEATADSPFVYSSAFNIVVNMRGDVVSISPTYYDLKEKYHFVALKPYPLDTDYMMGTVDIEKTQKGPVYLWNWRKNQAKEFVQLTEDYVVDCHDLNWNVGGVSPRAFNSAPFNRLAPPHLASPLHPSPPRIDLPSTLSPPRLASPSPSPRPDSPRPPRPATRTASGSRPATMVSRSTRLAAARRSPRFPSRTTS